MREIRFRAWQKHHKKMCDVLTIGFENNKIIKLTVKYPKGVCPQVVAYSMQYGDFNLMGDISRVFELMQYTGFNDDNGQPIYEGDIIQRTSVMPGGFDFMGVVKYINCSFWIDNTEDAIPLFEEVDSLKVVGNIYETPSLMEVEHEKTI